MTMPVSQLPLLLRYEPETGRLFWQERTPDLFADGKRSAAHACAQWNSCHAGKEAFLKRLPNGYLVGSIFNVKYPAHRVIWALVYGKLPENVIDHINGDKADNRLANLRAATVSQNGMNRGLPANNSSGCKGVSWDRACQKWQAKIGIHGKTIYLGNFDHLEAAKAAYAAASREVHGEFGRTQ